MALIEGVGDEVTLLFGSLLILLVLLLAWASTRTAEPHDHLFTAATPPAASYTDPRFSSTAASSPSSSVSEGSLTETSLSAAPLDDAGQQVKEEEDGGDALRSGGGGGGGEASAASLSSQRNMVLRLKFLNDTEITAQVQPQDTIGYIKRTYFTGQEQQVRLIYQGQLLQDDAQTLASLHLTHNCVLHCHISQHVPRGAPAGARPADQVQVALNMGSLMVPLLVLMLSVLWYCQIQYRQFFTAPATALLVGITIFLSLVAFGVYRR